MRRTVWCATCLLGFLLSGCATPKSEFQATWYIVDESREPGQTKLKMYVAIVNQSSEVIKVNAIIVNAVENKPQTGWRLVDGFDRDFEPGKILIRRIDFKGKETKGGCRVPVKVVVLAEPERHIRADMTGGAMPSSLPVGWETGC